ncbi:MAG: hypothetical protein RL417_435 [Pseudomonadota bacterium]|jgi:hypothetical protein
MGVGDRSGGEQNSSEALEQMTARRAVRDLNNSFAENDNFAGRAEEKGVDE